MSERDVVVVVADVSTSMEDRDGGSRERKTRFQLLQDALHELPKHVKIVVFSDHAHEVAGAASVTLLGGGTNLAAGVTLAARHSPVRTVIVSDGEPDSEEDAKRAVERLTGIVDVVFCGSPHNRKAREFLESLARAGGGGFHETGDQVDALKQLPAVVKGLLSS